MISLAGGELRASEVADRLLPLCQLCHWKYRKARFAPRADIAAAIEADSHQGSGTYM
jgi:hypothetical protein